MTTEKYYCDNCEKEINTATKSIEQEFDVKGEKIVANILIRVCVDCGEEVWDEELERKNEKTVYNLYREIKNLLKPEEIKNIRMSIGISQTAFAKLLGFGDKTIARYENGAIQESANDLLIRLMNNKENVKIAYEKAKPYLTDTECNKIVKYLQPNDVMWDYKCGYTKKVINCYTSIIYQTFNGSKSLYESKSGKNALNGVIV